MTNEIRIDDLAAPVLNDLQKMGIDYGESKHTELSVDAVCAAAVARTGLDDFGPDDFRDRLGVQLAEMDADAERTGIGRMIFFGDCVRSAANRLLIHDLLVRQPEILDMPIERPVIVVGLPRSGTTNLVNLLAADTRFRSMPLWESYEPVPNPREPAQVDGIDPRWTRCQQVWESMQAGAPFIAAMHPMEPDHVHEENELMAPDFSNYNVEWVARAPQWRDHYLAQDQTPHYAYLKQVLQILQWYRPRDRWVLKSPQHLEQFGPLISTFPDATVVVTHRDPASVVASMATMIAYTSRLSLDPVDPVGIGHYWADLLSTMLNTCLETRDLLPAERSVDVRFDEFMADDLATVERIYDLADQPFDDAARSAIGIYLAGHQRNRHGALIYDLADFDLDATTIRAGLSDYIDRFHIPLEPVASVAALRRELLDTVTDDDWERARGGFGDDDLATE